MGIIFCGKNNKKAYYIKEADMNIYSIQELSYFIFNYAMLISNSFVSKNLIYYINKDLEMTELSNKLNIMYNKKANIANMLKLILRYSNYYTEEDISKFDIKLLKLLELDEISYINLSGDNLYKLEKYEKAILQYEKIASKDYYAMKMLAFCYAKLQVYDKAIEYLYSLYNKSYDKDILKNLYFCYKLCSNIDGFSELKSEVSEETLTDWEIEIVTKLLNAKNSNEVKNMEEVFMMGDNFISDNINMTLKLWKEKYRYIS